jgi:hypothetical protein
MSFSYLSRWDGRREEQEPGQLRMRAERPDFSGVAA